MITRINNWFFSITRTAWKFTVSRSAWVFAITRSAWKFTITRNPWHFVITVLDKIDVWILYSGNWADQNIWVDSANWNDG